MQKVIELIEEANTKGIQIEIAGRINEKKIRVKWIQEGKILLQTI